MSGDYTTYFCGLSVKLQCVPHIVSRIILSSDDTVRYPVVRAKVEYPKTEHRAVFRLQSSHTN